MRYIDVSEWQGNIDWERAKPHIDGVIIRAGYGVNHIDAQFERNAAECNRLGIPCGAYWFSYARSPEMAKQEAEYLLAAVKPYKMQLPLCYDFEYDSVEKAQKAGTQITKALATAMVYAFCGAIEAGGYWALNYANPDFLSRYFSADVPQRFGLWLAMWPTNPKPENKPRPDCQIWQWGGSEIPGITPGKTVDTNESYTDFATLIAQYGLNHLQDEAPPVTTPFVWAKNNGLCGDVTEDSMVTWGDLANALYRIHGPEDDKSTSGLLS